MKLGLKRDRILRKEQTVYVEAKRHRRIAQFVNPFDGLKPTCESDLNDVLPECSSVRDDIHVSGPDVSRPIIILLDRFVDCS